MKDTKTKVLEGKVKDLLADFHEHGMPYMLSVVDKESGDSINAMEGGYEHLIVMTGILASRFVHEDDGFTIDDVVNDIKYAIVATIETDEAKNEQDD